MERYIQQLIEDLEKAAANPPVNPFVEPPPHFEGDLVTAELALVPYKSIEEWTGIKQEVFPEIIHLQGDQWERVNKAIFKVFDSLQIELVDVPREIPPEWLYEVLTTNWKHPVQYLPSSGMDLELCTGDPMTCPYGEFCDCGEDFDIYELPDKFGKCINRLAQAIDAGFICYLNPETLEMEEVQKSQKGEPLKNKLKSGSDTDDKGFKHKNWDNCYVFEPLKSAELFKIMKTFVENIDDEIVQAELFYVLKNKNSIANFEAVINKSRQSEKWFYFKMNWLEDNVKQIIFSEINKINKDENSNDDELPF